MSNRKLKAKKKELSKAKRKENYERRLEKLKSFLVDEKIPVKRRNIVYALVTDENNKFIRSKVNKVVLEEKILED